MEGAGPHVVGSEPVLPLAERALPISRDPHLHCRANLWGLLMTSSDLCVKEAAASGARGVLVWPIVEHFVQFDLGQEDTYLEQCNDEILDVCL